MNRTLFAVAVTLCSLLAGSAYAANAACEAQAAEKKLAGAAKTSFLKKCEKDAVDAATKTCDAQAAEQKLAGAAKATFTNKCVADSLKVGAKVRK